MSTGVQTAVGRFVWHDLATTDVDNAKDFYARLFGWETEVWKPGEMDYPMITANGQMHGGFGPAQGDAPPHWIGHVVVEDLDATVEKVKASGGSILAQDQSSCAGWGMPRAVLEAGLACAVLSPDKIARRIAARVEEHR